MNQKLVIDRLSSEWDRPSGFFALLRSGDYQAERADSLLEYISSLGCFDEELMDIQLVRLLWYSPIFVSWQRERVSESGGDVKGLAGFEVRLCNLLESLLGVP
jgi:hypothetical protein